MVPASAPEPSAATTNSSPSGSATRRARTSGSPRSAGTASKSARMTSDTWRERSRLASRPPARLMPRRARIFVKNEWPVACWVSTEAITTPIITAMVSVKFDVSSNTIRMVEIGAPSTAPATAPMPTMV